MVVRALDRALRAVLGIFEFCEREDCILRIALRRAPADVRLPGQIQLKRSDDLVELHFWNENLPVIYPCGSPFGWAIRFRTGMHLSLRLLAAQAVANPKLRNAKAFYARMVLPLDGRMHKCASFAAEYGFSVMKPPSSETQRVHDAFENLLVHALIWAFHPGTLKRRAAPLERVYWWITRDDLLSRYRPGLPSEIARKRNNHGASSAEETSLAGSPDGGLASGCELPARSSRKIDVLEVHAGSK